MQEENLKKMIDQLESVLSYTLGNLQSKDKKTIKELFSKVLDRNEECGDFGDCVSTINFMLFVRKKLKDQGLFPKDNMPYIDSETKGWHKNQIRYRQGLLTTTSEDSKYKKIYIQTFQEWFPGSLELEKLNESYDCDFWDYTKINKEIDDKEDWIGFGHFDRTTLDRTHYYYNELDHYITYLVGNIKRLIRGKDPRAVREAGLKELISELNDKTIELPREL